MPLNLSDKAVASVKQSVSALAVLRRAKAMTLLAESCFQVGCSCVLAVAGAANVLTRLALLLVRGTCCTMLWVGYARAWQRNGQLRFFVEPLLRCSGPESRPALGLRLKDGGKAVPLLARL